MALATGTKLGPYQVAGALGAGGMGEVYRARDTRLGRNVAIKILPASLAADASRLRRFEIEARAAATLNHPNILAVYDIGTFRPTSTDGTAAVAAAQESPYIVSELLEGETLRERLRGGALPVRKAIDYAQQIARGLAGAHDKGIVHRDLKPENMFVTEDGRVKILDFGLAKLTRPETAGGAAGPVDSDAGGGQTLTQPLQSEAGTVLGTVGYMSPEQVRGKPADARSDLFSFGAILYEMLSGKRAFHGDSAADTMSAILNQEPAELTETNRTVPPALERVVRHCLEKNPAERFQSARDIAFDLEALTSLSGASGPQRPITVPTARRWTFAALAVVATIALLLVGAVVGRRTAPQATIPSYEQLTFRRGTIYAAKLAANGQVIYSAAWEGKPMEVFISALSGRGATTTGVQNAQVQAVSSGGDVLVISGQRIVFANVRPGTLSRMPLTGGAPRPLLEEVQDADWAPDGTNIAVSHYVSERFRLEFPIGKVLYETSGYISSPRVSPKGDKVAFLDHPQFGDDMGTVSIIDSAGHKRDLTQAFASLQGLQWSPSGDELWFSGSRSGVTVDIYAVNLEGRTRAVASAPGGLRLLDIAPDGRAVVAQGRLRIASVVERADQKGGRDLTVADWSIPRDISADGTTVLIDEESDTSNGLYSPYLRKTDGSPPLKLGEGYQADSLSPDGQWVLASTQRTPTQLVLLPTGAGAPQQVSNDNIDHRFATFVPDGSAILFSGVEPGKRPRVYLQSISGGGPRPLTSEGVSGTMQVSPDGKRLCVTGDHTWIVQMDGGAAKLVPTKMHGQFVVRWAADGRSIYVTGGEHGSPTRALYRLDPETGNSELFRQFTAADAAGVVGVGPIRATPDLKAFVYGVSRDLNELYLVKGLR